MKPKSIIITLILCILLAVVASYIASSYPDGLEWVAEKMNFIDTADIEPALKAPMPDYELPGVNNKAISSVLVAVCGIATVFASAYLLGKVIRKIRK